MKKNNEFQEIGKRMTYKVPDGFFKQVSEKTLRKAKQREQNHRKSLLLWRTVAVASSLSALALLGYFMFEPGKPEKNLIVQEKQPVTIQILEQKKEISKQSAVDEIKKVIPENILVKENEVEGISDVLADLTDDELLQMAARFKTDPFIGESPQ